MKLSEITPAIALRTVAQKTFRPFDEGDWQAFSGCESENPLIEANPAEGEPIWIIDGDVIFVWDLSDNADDAEPESVEFELYPRM